MGRKPKSELDQIRARIWFAIIATTVGSDSPRYLERLFQPDHLKRNSEGKLNDSRAWDKYRSGFRRPSDGAHPVKGPGAVMAAEKSVPDSAYIYRHPMWSFLAKGGLAYQATLQIIGRFRPYVRRWYFDLAQPLRGHQIASFGENIGMPVLIGTHDNFTDVFDHLCAQLMILKILDFHHQPVHLFGIAENLSGIIRHLSAEPQLRVHHVEFFDFLERNCWDSLFDKHYEPDIVSVHGWRKVLINAGE